ncbi:MAG: hypothetical protein JWO43_2 [Candidatus Adlerbacteria bacterium]|nr:hypothetical protein [Candidatus Adlerbacteria bacterium]
MDKPRTTPKDFFLWAGAMVTLYWSIVAFINLMFDYITHAFPSNVGYYYDAYQGGSSWEMASIIVMFPIFVILMRIIHRDIEKDSARGEIWVRRWALFLTLFIAGITMALDLVVLLTTFLQGEEITTAFLLKVVVVFLVAATVFMHFMADYWGFWEKYPTRARMVGYAAGALALLSVVAGFFILGTPQQARQYRTDAQRVSDLQMIQGQIVSYWQSKEQLPPSLTSLADSVGYFTVPTDPETDASYEYRATGGTNFELCATFVAPSRDVGGMVPSYAYPSDIAAPEKWQHSTGQTCFTRSIDPDIYPPYNPKPIPAR